MRRYIRKTHTISARAAIAAAAAAGLSNRQTAATVYRMLQLESQSFTHSLIP